MTPLAEQYHYVRVALLTPGLPRAIREWLILERQRINLESRIYTEDQWRAQCAFSQ